jgi:ABC-type nitrate/sulfonate/bicarbonate transport system substrate-binding protein
MVGKSIGVGSPGDASHQAVVAALAANGIREDQVTFISNLTAHGPALTAMQSDAINSVVVTAPTDTALERLGYRGLGFLGDYRETLSAGVATQDDTIRDRPAMVHALVRAMQKSHRYMQANRQGTIVHMARFMDVGEDETSDSYDRYMPHLTKDGLSTPDRLERIVSYLREEVGVEQPVTVNDLFDLSFARRAAAELDAAGWRP